MGAFSKLKFLLEEKENFLLICHEQPDGDAVGAMIGLGLALKDRKKKVTMACKDEIPAVFTFVSGAEDVKKDFLLGDYDAVILLDNGDFRRTGFLDRLKKLREKSVPIINIDHHPKNDLWKSVSINYVDQNVSSSSELVYEILKGIGCNITPQIATALLLGIYTDTGGFQHSNTSDKVMRVAADLLSHGARIKKISDNISLHNSIPRLKLWGIALNRLKINERYGIVSSYLTKNDIEKADASEEEVSGLVNLINSVPQAKIALLLYETSDGKIRGSLRTESENVDVSKLAKILGGGGHKKAAGFTVEGRIEQFDGYWKIA